MTQHSAPDYHFSAHAGRLPASPANRILDMAAEPGLISLAAGNPAPEAYPVKEIRRIAGEILDREPMAALPYSVPQGDPGLRAAVLDFLAGKFTPANGDGCLIVTGAQQGADLTARVLLDPGDTVLCEAPTFLGVMDAFRATGARLRGIPMAEDGIDLAALEAALREEKRVRLLYTIPNFQNPTGITLPAEKREALCRLAERYDFIILEDDPYGDLRFSGEALPPVKAFDREGRVLYMGSFSKILAPGVRTGYLVGAKPVIDRLTTLKSACDVHSNSLGQLICKRFLEEVDLGAHLERLRGIYRARCGQMLRALEREFDPRVRWTRPEGGLFLWCTLPEEDALPFVERAAAEGVLVVPGAGFLPEPDAVSPSFRLNFSTPTAEEMERGIAILGRLTKEPAVR